MTRASARPRAAALRGGVRRLLHLVWIGGLHLAALLVARLAGSSDGGGRLPAWLARRLPARLMRLGPSVDGPDRLRMLFEDLGGTYIKFGQMLALQPDILDRRYCNALFKLLDQVDPFDADIVARIVEDELGAPPAHCFADFDRAPLATASVGQVHVAHLTDGRKVAVKVQRPNVDAEFWSDIRLMLLTIAVIRTLRIAPLYWMLEPLREFVGWTRDELDYRNEARYMGHLRRIASRAATQYVPEAIDALSTRRVLTVEFLDGTTLLDYLRARERGDAMLPRRLAQRGFEPNRFAAHLIDNFLGGAFRDGIYHADLHPANLMILDDNVVGYIDFGITGVVSRHGRRNLLAMTLALAQGDMDLFQENFLRVSAFRADADPVAFRAGLDVLAAGWYVDADAGFASQPAARGGRRLQASFTRIMTEMLALSRRTGVLPERDIIKYIRSSIAVDGLLTRFAPSFDLGHYLERACRRYLVREARRRQLAPDRWLDAGQASARLLRDGPVRLTRALDRAAARSPASGVPPDPPAAARVTRLAALVAAAAVAATLVDLSSVALAPSAGATTASLFLTLFTVAASVLLGFALLGRAA
ncbi:MAG: AarF/UbiB family protein [Acidobacteriota bacterium]